MSANWDTYSRQGIDLAHTATSLGFSAVKRGTRLGFSIARNIATTTVGITASAVDLALFGGSAVASPVVGGAVASAFTIAEQITLAPIHLSEYLTSTSLIAAHSSVNVLSVIFPGSSDASFSLASFIGLVRREWAHGDGESWPERKYKIPQVARAMVAWISLQGVTQEWQENRWFKHLRELNVQEPSKPRPLLSRRGSRIRVTSDVIFPGQCGAQIVAADIGEAPPRLTRSRSWLRSSRTSLSHLTSIASVEPLPPRDPVPLSNAELKTTLRRLSKMVLAGYGGASLLFFGVSPYLSSGDDPCRVSEDAFIAREKKQEEAQLTHAIDASEAEAAGSTSATDPASAAQYSWWDVLMGKHDQEIFERFAGHGENPKSNSTGQPEAEARTAEMKATAVVGKEHLMPRFWVLTDYNRSQIVLVLRGTMSLNEIAVDLTCDPETFEPATTRRRTRSEDEHHVPGRYGSPEADEERSESYSVHGGILKLAKAMGGVGKPVQLAVLEALHHNPNFDLVICGHSLGAGVAAILGMMWADPKTCLTVRSSGLPVGRRVYVYCFAPPCVGDVRFGKLADKLIVSFVNSHDVVARLSLGTVRDMKNAAVWLCDANANEASRAKGEGYPSVTARARRWKAGFGSKDDPQWFIALRKSLEANMQNASLFPPGRVLWAMRNSDLHPSHQIHLDGTRGDKLRLFEVLDVEQVFSQIVFARNMLSAHLPHQYDQVLHDLL